MNKKKKIIISIVVTLFILFGIFVIYEIITTYNAHKTFEGYCKWRGLAVESKSANFGFCKNFNIDKEYKIVLFENKWYLDGDLPCGFLCL